jgi:hypothetical protein
VDNIKKDLGEIERGGIDCEHDNEPSGAITVWEVLK